MNSRKGGKYTKHTRFTWSTVHDARCLLGRSPLKWSLLRPLPVFTLPPTSTTVCIICLTGSGRSHCCCYHCWFNIVISSGECRFLCLYLALDWVLLTSYLNMRDGRTVSGSVDDEQFGDSETHKCTFERSHFIKGFVSIVSFTCLCACGHKRAHTHIHTRLKLRVGANYENVNYHTHAGEVQNGSEPKTV